MKLSEQELIQICRKYELPCPVCETSNTYYRLKRDICRPKKIEGDGHPRQYEWGKAGFDSIDPKLFFWGVCKKCRFTGELDDAEFRQAAELGDKFKGLFRPEELQRLLEGGNSGKGLAQSLGRRIKEEDLFGSVLAQFHLGIYCQTLRLRIIPGNLARYYLRVAWLYRDQPMFYPEADLEAIAADFSSLVKRWEKDLPEHSDYPVRPGLALNEVDALRFSRTYFERNYETLREARLEDELRLRQLLAEIGFRIYELTAEEDDYRKASSFFSGLMQQCLNIISDKRIVGGVVNRARGMLEMVGERGRELRELHKSREGGEAGEAKQAPVQDKRTKERIDGKQAMEEKRQPAEIEVPPEPQRELDQARRQVAVLQEEVEGLKTRLHELEEDNKKWRQLAGRDAVTGLPNKTMLFRLVIPKMLKNLGQTGPFSCIAIGFEQVGQVNLQHGWLMGDRMLKESVATLRQFVQEGEELYRLDGVHFALVGPMSNSVARQRAAEIRRRLAQSNVQVGNTRLPLVASLGVVTVERLGGTPLAEVANALYAALLTTLYKAREKGGNSVEVYTTTRF